MSTDKPEKSFRVENMSGGPVWVPGGLLEPGVVAERPDSEQLSELMSNKVLREEDDYSFFTKDDLQARVYERGLEVKGTGADGVILKTDLEKALKAADRKGS